MTVSVLPSPMECANTHPCSLRCLDASLRVGARHAAQMKRTPSTCAARITAGGHGTQVPRDRVRGTRRVQTPAEAGVTT
eukprot:scaffold12093_cov137-Isochrysis_galbana.AAC.6